MEQQTDLEAGKKILHHDTALLASQNQTQDTTTEREWQRREEVYCRWKERATLVRETLSGEVCLLSHLWEKVPFLDVELLAVRNADDNRS